VAAIAVDPWVEFLDRGPVDIQVISAMFRQQTALAREAGHQGVRVVADMDWLLASKPSNEDIVAFELLLDRVVTELGATVVCAYRANSFSPELFDGVLAVHPTCLGHADGPQFRFVAGDPAGRQLSGLVAAGPVDWRLSGEVDVAVRSAFATALRATALHGTCVIDVTDLEFIDVAGMRLLAEHALIHGVGVYLRGASPTLRRAWQLCGFDELAPAFC
jgi:anti-anti-sigma factor